ncbi:MAG: NADH-quinone oxidoreductase subunit C [Acidobacteria bacterium]|nr:NADH-quinone oxidoreductase subunit C [Acidobacteriota bacterium]
MSESRYDWAAPWPSTSHGVEAYLDVPRELIPGALAALREHHSARLTSVFCEDRVMTEQCFYNYYVLESPAQRAYLVLRAGIPASDPVFPSVSAAFPSANWQEREIQDWFGLTAQGHPNPRRVALHDNWPDVHPLRKEFSAVAELPFAGEQHVYRPTLGEGVFQIPVGPVHAGIIEPGHFSFSVAGEPILYLQLRMFYVHKGIEKRFEQLPVGRCVALAESISGDSSFSHGVAFCQALETVAGLEIPARAEAIRTILLELERIYNHIADIGAIATDVGFVIANAHASRLREMLFVLNEGLTGSRLLRGMVCPGGVRRDWNREQVVELSETLRQFETEFRDLMDIIESSDSTRDRLEHTGVLPTEQARELGVVGVAGRASGIDRDVRRDHPYAAYRHWTVDVPVYTEGDVLRRMMVRVKEIGGALFLIRALLASLTDGAHRVPLPPLEQGRVALSAVEGWRGEILHWIRTGPNNRLERCRIKDPSLNNWPALVEAVKGNIVPDFPVINKSFNLSYSGTDR